MEGDLTDIEKQLALEDWSRQNLFVKKNSGVLTGNLKFVSTIFLEFIIHLI